MTQEVLVRSPSVGCLVIFADLHIAHSLLGLLQFALCCYQTAKARTLCVCYYTAIKALVL